MRVEEILGQGRYDFSAKYMASCRLNDMIHENEADVTSRTIAIIESLYTNPEILAQSQAYFLFRELSRGLCAVAVRGRNDAPEHDALSALMSVLSNMRGSAHRAAAEALGALPFRVQGPAIDLETPPEMPMTSLEGFLKEVGVAVHGPFQWMGRSLVAPVNGNGRLLVLKLGDAEASTGLYAEARWMAHLAEGGSDVTVPFDIPRSIRVQGSPVFRLQMTRDMLPDGPLPDRVRYAIGFMTHTNYFQYPNGARPERRLKPETFQEVMLRNAFLFGHLTARGIVHSAPIPLFHNRVQSLRRADRGLYEWQRAGRLDRWLGSCRYPNFGVSGIRDFEHFISFDGWSRRLYPHVGTQLLSLLLVAGSYFRNLRPDLVGKDKTGEPVDARHLFDREFLRELIAGLFDAYYHGFCGCRFKARLPVNLDCLAGRMVEEMGVDRHMEEVLRITDQSEMGDAEFHSFLEQRGFTKEAAEHTPKGVADISLETGPHLGDFNQRISLPEMIEAVESMTSLCILGRYCQVAGLDPAPFRA